ARFLQCWCHVARAPSRRSSSLRPRSHTATPGRCRQHTLVILAVVAMKLGTSFVILSSLALLGGGGACSRAERAAEAEGPPRSPEGDVIVNATSAPARPAAHTEAPALRRVPVLERRGDSEGPIPYRV